MTICSRIFPPNVLAPPVNHVFVDYENVHQLDHSVIGINTEEIESRAMNLSSLPEQQNIVRRVESIFAFADRIEALLATAQKTVERLTPVTLARLYELNAAPLIKPMRGRRMLEMFY